jgi:hypothetical protein
MDACLMSNLEVAYQAEPYVKYIVASEESEPDKGWPYSDILDMLNKNPGISTPEFCSEIVKVYTDSYKGGDQSKVTQSAFDLSRVKDATKSLDLLAEALIDQMPDINLSLTVSIQFSEKIQFFVKNQLTVFINFIKLPLIFQLHNHYKVN